MKKNIYKSALYSIIPSVILTIITSVIVYYSIVSNLVKYQVPLYLWLSGYEMPTGGGNPLGSHWWGSITILPIPILPMIGIFLLIFFILSIVIFKVLNKKPIKK